MQLMCHTLGGEVKRGDKGEYGLANINMHAHAKNSQILDNIQSESMKVWMSHRDKVVKLPANFTNLAHSDTCEYAAIENDH